eukprot:6266775-Pyramimonas_sp.AAC.2
MEGAENLRVLHEQMEKLRAEAAEARHAKAQAAADAEFHRERYNRLVEASDAARQQTEQLAHRNAALAREITDHQKALQSATHSRDVSLSPARPPF